MSTALLFAGRVSVRATLLNSASLALRHNARALGSLQTHYKGVNLRVLQSISALHPHATLGDLSRIAPDFAALTSDAAAVGPATARVLSPPSTPLAAVVNCLNEHEALPPTPASKRDHNSARAGAPQSQNPDINIKTTVHNAPRHTTPKYLYFIDGLCSDLSSSSRSHVDALDERLRAIKQLVVPLVPVTDPVVLKDMGCLMELALAARANSPPTTTITIPDVPEPIDISTKLRSRYANTIPVSFVAPPAERIQFLQSLVAPNMTGLLPITALSLENSTATSATQRNAILSWIASKTTDGIAGLDHQVRFHLLGWYIDTCRRIANSAMPSAANETELLSLAARALNRLGDPQSHGAMKVCLQHLLLTDAMQADADAAATHSELPPSSSAAPSATINLYARRHAPKILPPTVATSSSQATLAGPETVSSSAALTMAIAEMHGELGASTTRVSGYFNIAPIAPGVRPHLDQAIAACEETVATHARLSPMHVGAARCLEDLYYRKALDLLAQHQYLDGVTIARKLRAMSDTASSLIDAKAQMLEGLIKLCARLANKRDEKAIEKALQLMEKGMATATAVLPLHSPMGPSLLMLLAVGYRLAGKRQAAYDKALTAQQLFQQQIPSHLVAAAPLEFLKMKDMMSQCPSDTHLHHEALLSNIHEARLPPYDASARTSRITLAMSLSSSHPDLSDAMFTDLLQAAREGQQAPGWYQPLYTTWAGHVLFARALLALRNEHLDAALQYAQGSVDAAVSLDAKVHKPGDLLAKALTLQGNVLRQLGRDREALDKYKQALVPHTIKSNLQSYLPKSYVELLASMGPFALEQGDLDTAEQYCRLVMELPIVDPKLKYSAMFGSLRTLVAVQRARGQSLQALDTARQFVTASVARDGDGPVSSDTLHAHIMEGMVLMDLKRFAEAAQVLSSAADQSPCAAFHTQAILTGGREAEHQTGAGSATAGTLGVAHHHRRVTSTAAVTDVDRQLYRMLCHDTMQCYRNLGRQDLAQMYWDRGAMMHTGPLSHNASQAQHLQRAEQLVATARQSLATLLDPADRSKFAKCRDMLLEAKTLFSELHGPQSESVASCLTLLCTSYSPSIEAEVSQAQQYLDAALQVAQAVVPADQHRIIQIHEMIAQFAEARNDLDAVIEHASAALAIAESIASDNASQKPPLALHAHWGLGMGVIDDVRVRLCMQLADVLSKQGNTEFAILSAKEAMEVVEVHVDRALSTATLPSDSARAPPTATTSCSAPAPLLVPELLIPYIQTGVCYGELLESVGREDPAVTVLSKVLKIANESLDDYDAKGATDKNVFLAQGTIAIEAMSHVLKGCAMLGELCEKLGRHREAIAARLEIVELAGGVEHVWAMTQGQSSPGSSAASATSTPAPVDDASPASSASDSRGSVADEGHTHAGAEHTHVVGGHSHSNMDAGAATEAESSWSLDTLTATELNIVTESLRAGVQAGDKLFADGNTGLIALHLSIAESYLALGEHANAREHVSIAQSRVGPNTRGYAAKQVGELAARVA